MCRSFTFTTFVSKCIDEMTMSRFLLFIILILIRTLMGSPLSINKEKRVRRLVRNWAPLVWLAPGEKFLPLGVSEFLDNVQLDQYYLRTKIDTASLLKNRSSFLYGRKPAGTVPVYALVKNCIPRDMRRQCTSSLSTSNNRVPRKKRSLKNVKENILRFLLHLGSSVRFTDDIINDLWAQVALRERMQQTTVVPQRFARNKDEDDICQKQHFHVTYWMFYPFSEGKTLCTLDLGFFGSWPIPTIGGKCVGTLKEYGSHIGDWEHMSLHFKNNDYPLAMYVSAHDSGAFYRYHPQNGTFVYESQETRKGLFQKPIFPETVYTAGGSHAILFSARGSHGLWTAPGKHKFIRMPRLYDEGGFGTAWPTWKRLELLSEEDSGTSPGWMTFKGKWGNPSNNCHPLAKLGFNICEFVDGPTGIPMKKFNFQC